MLINKLFYIFQFDIIGLNYRLTGDINMKRCPVCDNELNVEDKFCSQCGINLNLYSERKEKSEAKQVVFFNPPGLAQYPHDEQRFVEIVSDPEKELIKYKQQRLQNIINCMKENNDYHKRNRSAVEELVEIIPKNEVIQFVLTGELFIKNLTEASSTVGYVSSFNNLQFLSASEIDGFYRFGVICITNFRTIFVTNSEKFHSVREFNNNSVTEIILDKFMDCGNLKVNTNKGSFVFSIGNYDNAKKMTEILKRYYEE